MATTQEKLNVGNYEIRLLADDCAPDAESAYAVYRRYRFFGTFAEAEASAREAIRAHRLCGCEIHVFDWVTQTLKLAGGFIGSFDDEDDHQGSYHDYDD